MSSSILPHYLPGMFRLPKFSYNRRIIVTFMNLRTCAGLYSTLFLIVAPPQHNAGMDIPKPTAKMARSLKDTFTMFCKSGKKPTAPSAAACIEEEHRLKIKHMEEEHKLRMELLRAKIKQTKAKTEVQKSLLATLKDSPKIFLQRIKELRHLQNS
ncbi:hypothetical protein TNCT_664831 [Trichonephila clavata]|uniref:Uncharacterized protein n=1 Tax=Trichonephila clavata TaxID=2740835 RepID=A0A8X6G6Q7_TRICU|nr:hypothetical protein TNCT_664831 [Trichonephila clavata]